MNHIARLKFCPEQRDKSLALAANGDHLDLPRDGDVLDHSARPAGRRLDREQADLPAAKGQHRIQLGVGEQLVDALGSPGGGGDGQQSQALVNFCPARIIEARHDSGHMEDIACNAGGYYIALSEALVAAKASACSMPAFSSTSIIETDPLNLLATEIFSQPGQGGRIVIDHRDIVTFVRHQPGELLPNPAAAHDNNFHTTTFLVILT